MRVLGLLLFLSGAAATGYATWAIYERKRPQDVLAAVIAPVSMIITVLGLVLIFVPGFF